MRTTRVTLKDGTKLSGPIWEWKPAEGYFTLVGAAPNGDPARVLLRDVAEGVTERMWVSKDVIKDVDVIERAKKDGWDGVK